MDQRQAELSGARTQPDFGGRCGGRRAYLSSDLSRQQQGLTPDLAHGAVETLREAVHDEAIALVRELLGVPANYEVLLLQAALDPFLVASALYLVSKAAAESRPRNCATSVQRW